jgi:hypothetical protein
MTTLFNREQGWKWATVAYLGLSGLTLLVAEDLDKLPAAILQPLFVVLGPTAWLLWGPPMTPFYVVATMVFVASLIGTVFLRLHAAGIGPLAFWFSGLVWFLLGFWAWSFNV